MRPLLLALAGLALVAGCLVPVRPPDLTVRLDAERVAAVRDSLTASGTAWPGVVARQFAEAGLTPLADGSFRAGLDGAMVGGLVPGREPIARPSLVVVGVAASDPEAATVLEAARLLVGRSKRELVPERSVLFVVWSGPTWPAIEAVRRSAVWPRDLVAAALVVGEAPEVSGFPVSSLDANGPASVEGLVARIAEAARKPAASLEADTLDAR